MGWEWQQFTTLTNLNNLTDSELWNNGMKFVEKVGEDKMWNNATFREFSSNAYTHLFPLDFDILQSESIFRDFIARIYLQNSDSRMMTASSSSLKF